MIWVRIPLPGPVSALEFLTMLYIALFLTVIFGFLLWRFVERLSEN